MADVASASKSGIVVKPKEVKLAPSENAAQQELRQKRERLAEIKEKLSQPGGHFGIGIFNTGRSYNKFTTKPYEELAQIQKKENRFRKILGQRPNKKPINNTENGYKPEIDPRILRAGLKQKRSYHAGGKLNMVTLEATNAIKEKKVSELEAKAEKEGRELDEKELLQFEPSASIIKR